MSHTLPVPSAQAKAHSDQLFALIKQQIKQQGPLSFVDYMRMALYEPGLGYYSAGAVKFGDAGDFVTAPMISPLFSQCVARQCAEVLAHVNHGVILELGAGTGQMALDILQYLQTQQQLPEHYYILEVSADLKKRQQTLFQEQAPELLSCVSWLERLPAKPINGVILANEVLDAMPVHVVRYQNGWYEYYVDCADDHLMWQTQPVVNNALQHALASVDVAGLDGYQTEVNVNIAPWLASLSDCLQHGMILCIDYGFPRHEYYHHDRHMGTLMCHLQHHAHPDPLVYPGIQDITAHVDFTAVAEAAMAADLSVSGYCHQAAFLLGCGIEQLFSEITDQVQQINVAQQMKRLLMPQEMGELFKVIALTCGTLPELMGFSIMNQVERVLK